jgi:4-hydroxythreonine-4-phosphate dehydrogenase
MAKHKIRVGITMGDPAGIGPAITAKAINKLKGLAEFVIIGDAWVFRKVKSSKSKVKSCFFLDLNNVSHKDFEFGKIKAEYGRASMEYLDKALELIRKEKINCLVTCPISKESINKAGFKYSGHTEYLAEYANSKNLVMMLINKHLRFSLVTRHIPISCVSAELTSVKLHKTIWVTYGALKKMFLIRNPKIAVCGLNPHASDNGLIGFEENRIIKPVLRMLRNKVKNLFGPIASDVAIHNAYKRIYDCVIAIYHDQALIPLKLFSNNFGVNITLGLPFVRTSPLHGTAFDIAKDYELSNPASLIEAVKLAIKCTLNLRSV